MAPGDAMTPTLEGGRAVLAAQPFSVALGTELCALSADGAELAMAIRTDHQQQHGFAHGGVVSYLADNALTFAAGGALGSALVTVEMKINYVRPAVGERLIARASVVSAGKTFVVTRCDVFVVRDGDEKLCAAAQGTIARLPPTDATA